MNETKPILREGLRSESYRLLAACFYPPQKDRLLEEKTCLSLAGTLNDLYPEAAAGPHAELMHQQLTEAAEVRLQVDHAALFHGPFHLKAPPYGSTYLEKGYALMGDTTLAARSFYTAEGLELAIREPADHITVELEFMHYLSSHAARALSDADQQEATRLAHKQQQFLGEHLGAWAPAFCVSIKKNAETLYFQALADCLQAFIRAEIRRTDTAVAST